MHLFFVQPSSVLGQSFESGSNGSDRALNLTDTTAPIIFNPADYNPPLDPDGDGVYHFTTITVAQGVTVKFRADVLGSRPVVWLAQGKVQIDGTLDLNGENGHAWNGPRKPSIAGAGGYGGGRGATDSQGSESGEGPGGGASGRRNEGGDGGGHVSAGYNCGQGGGPSYGNSFLLPLIGGSGGGGASTYEREGKSGAGGGAGGGALLISSSNGIAVAGGVSADGGSSGSPHGYHAGGGSGGAIRLVAPSISGSGYLVARGGAVGCNGSPGRIRLEAFPSGFDFSGNASPTYFSASPVRVFPKVEPKLRVSAVGAVPVPNSPTGSFAMPDVTIDQITPVTLMIEAKNIPLGTVVKLRITPENGGVFVVDSTPLAGTVAASTATAEATLPPGFARFFVTATWNP